MSAPEPPVVGAPRDEAVALLRRRLATALGGGLVVVLTALALATGFVGWSLEQRVRALRDAIRAKEALQGEVGVLEFRRDVAEAELQDVESALAAEKADLEFLRRNASTLWTVFPRRAWLKGVHGARQVAEPTCHRGTTMSPTGNATFQSCGELLAAGTTVWEGELVDGPFVQWWPNGPGQIPDCACIRATPPDGVRDRTPVTASPPGPSPAVLPVPVPPPQVPPVAPVPTTVVVEHPPGGEGRAQALVQALDQAGFVAATRRIAVASSTTSQMTIHRCGDRGSAAEVEAIRTASGVAAPVVDGCERALSDVVVSVPGAVATDFRVHVCWDSEWAFDRQKRGADRECEFITRIALGGQAHTCVVPRSAEGPVEAACPLGFWADPSKVEVSACENDVPPDDACGVEDPAADEDDDNELTCGVEAERVVCTRAKDGRPYRQFSFRIEQG